MSAPPTWPPPPTTPNPMAAHDELLTALVCAPVTKPPLSRLRLAQALRETTWLNLHEAARLDLGQCHTIVNNFCDRHGILPQHRGMQVWLPILSPSIFFLMALIFSDVFEWRELTIAPNRIAKHLLMQEQTAWNHYFPYLMLVPMAALVLVNSLAISRRTQREAEAAREKMSQ